MVGKIEKELQSATKTKYRGESERPGGDNRQGFLRRMLDVVAGFKDDDWNELTSEAQEWVNAATRADNAKTALPEIPNGNADEGEEEESTVAKASKGKSTKPAKEPKAKAPKAEVEAAAAKENGVKVQIKRAILKQPDIGVDDLMAKMGPKASRSTVAAVRAEFRHSLRVLQAEGHLKNVEI